MSNSYRLQAAGCTYHVNTKAVAGVKAFPRMWHRDVFLRMFARELELSAWECLGYAILGTHYHVIVRLRKPTLSSGFQRLNSRYARWYNREHNRAGALWQRRFDDRPVETDAHLMELQRYLAYNAPRAQLSETPEDWPYCHYGALLGLHPPDGLVRESELLGLFSPHLDRARSLLRKFVEERDPRVRRQTLLRRGSDAEN
jgi:REP element-mobilizing transposase RayT